MNSYQFTRRLLTTQIMSEKNTNQEEESTNSETPSTDATIVSGYKVLGEESTTDSVGVLGRNTQSSKTAFGVQGVTQTTDSLGVGVLAEAPNGAQGLRATASGNYAAQAKTTGYTALYAETDGDGYNAVHGYNSSGTGLSYGVRGDTASTNADAFGVRGRATSSSGSAAKGVGGITQGDGTGAAGVHGEAAASSGEVYGVYGTSASSSGYGVYSDGDSKTAGNQEVTGHQSVGNLGLSAYLSADQSVPDSTETIIVFDGVNRDDFSAYDETTGDFTVPADGDYRVEVSISWVGTFSGAFITHNLQINGVPDNGFALNFTGNDQVSRSHSKTLFGLSSGDTINVEVRHIAGSSKDVAGASNGTKTYLTITKVG